MHLPVRRLPSLLAGLLALTLLAGCAGDAMSGGHISGQIGRFYGDGVSFSVPLVRPSEKAGEPDVYWEVRQAIDNTLVVALSPLTGSGDRFRETVVVATEALPSPLSASQFREQQLPKLVQEGGLQGEPALGEDAAGPWAEYTRTLDGVPVRCKAWFFTRPAQGSDGPRGYVMVGSAQAGSEAESYLSRFHDIASTFRFGAPPSGFVRLGQVVDAVAAAATSSEGGAPSPEGAAPAEASPAGDAAPVPSSGGADPGAPSPSGSAEPGSQEIP